MSVTVAVEVSAFLPRASGSLMDHISAFVVSPRIVLHQIQVLMKIKQDERVALSILGPVHCTSKTFAR